MLIILHPPPTFPTLAQSGFANQFLFKKIFVSVAMVIFRIFVVSWECVPVVAPDTLFVYYNVYLLYLCVSACFDSTEIR